MICRVPYLNSTLVAIKCQNYLSNTFKLLIKPSPAISAIKNHENLVTIIGTNLVPQLLIIVNNSTY